jgi:hypothetical protein
LLLIMYYYFQFFFFIVRFLLSYYSKLRLDENFIWFDGLNIGDFKEKLPKSVQLLHKHNDWLWNEGIWLWWGHLTITDRRTKQSYHLLRLISTKEDLKFRGGSGSSRYLFPRLIYNSIKIECLPCKLDFKVENIFNKICYMPWNKSFIVPQSFIGLHESLKLTGILNYYRSLHDEILFMY